MTEEYRQRLFGTESDGVLYIPPAIMKAAKVKPGDRLKITPEKDGGFRVSRTDIEPRPGGQP
ncbi:MAG: hypothetical protein ACREBU_16225 [Nitrososphaera sp.]